MVVEQEIVIDKGINDCWKVMGVGYTEIYRWASFVHDASGDGKPAIEGASCDIRGCNVEGMGDIEEKLTTFDPKNYAIAYTVTKGLPNMMKGARNSWRLRSLGENKTQLNMRATFETKGLMGNLMGPMMKMQFNGMLRKTVEEFKYFVEQGEPHPRKLKAQAKKAA